MASPINGQTPSPPAGYKLDVAPPSGYSLDPMPDYSDVPSFLSKGIDMSKVRQVATEPQNQTERNATAEVDSTDPYKVKVLAPDLYGPPILNHELTHTFQDTRNTNLPQVSAPIKQSGRAAYDYGGASGLVALRSSGKTVSDLNAEQQADMVKDYKVFHDQYLKKAAEGKITKDDERAMYQAQQAYHPFIKQLASMPDQKINLDRNSLLELIGAQKPVEIRENPEAPGLPSYDTPGLGVLPVDKLLGGKSPVYCQGKTDEPQFLIEFSKKILDSPKTSMQTIPFSVVYANPERSKRGIKERGGLEFWSPNDTGDKDFPHPRPGKNVLEIYSSDLKNNPTALKQAVYGDLMHGMSSDPYWKGLRDEFMQSFTPQELKRQEQRQTWWNDVNSSK